MDEKSFIGTKKGIDEVLTTTQSAYLDYEATIMNTKAYQECQVELIPWRQIDGYVSMVVSKDSPLKKFMDKIILELIDTGIIQKSRLKWSVQKANCQTEASPLSPQKLILTFIGISIGMVFAVAILVVEKMIWISYHKDRNQQKYDYIREELRVCMEKIKICKKLIPDEQLIAILREVCQTPERVCKKAIT